MKAFFKDNNKIIINSMEHNETLVGKQFIDNITSKQIKVEQRYDINDDFDGLVISLVDKEEEIIPVVNPTTTQFKFEQITNEAPTLSFNIVPVDETIIAIDYNEEVINILINFLTNIGCTDVTYHPIKGFNATITDSITNQTYTLPEGAITAHKIHSEEVFTNQEITIEFTSTVVDEPTEEEETPTE